jgi:hypothetical protein
MYAEAKIRIEWRGKMQTDANWSREVSVIANQQSLGVEIESIKVLRNSSV